MSSAVEQSGASGSGRVVVRATVSSDGFLVDHARGGLDLLDWYFRPAPEPRDRSAAVTARTVDQVPGDCPKALIIGRRMYEAARGGHCLSWAAACVFVVSRSVPAMRERAEGHAVTFVTGGLVRAVGLALRSAGTGDVVLPGGYLCGQALDNGLVDVFRLRVTPDVLSHGVPLGGGHAHIPRLPSTDGVRTVISFPNEREDSTNRIVLD